MIEALRTLLHTPVNELTVLQAIAVYCLIGAAAVVVGAVVYRLMS